MRNSHKSNSRPWDSHRSSNYYKYDMEDEDDNDNNNNNYYDCEKFNDTHFCSVSGRFRSSFSFFPPDRPCHEWSRPLRRYLLPEETPSSGGAKKAVQAEADQEDEEQQEQEEEEQQQPLRRLSYDVQNINDQNDDMQVYRIV